MEDYHSELREILAEVKLIREQKKNPHPLLSRKFLVTLATGIALFAAGATSILPQWSSILIVISSAAYLLMNVLEKLKTSSE